MVKRSNILSNSTIVNLKEIEETVDGITSMSNPAELYGMNDKKIILVGEVNPNARLSLMPRDVFFFLSFIPHYPRRSSLLNLSPLEILATWAHNTKKEERERAPRRSKTYEESSICSVL